MEFTRKLGAILLLILAIGWFALGALYLVVGRSAIRDTVAHSREIQSSFVQAANYVDQFRAKHAQLPTPSEFSRWAEAHSNSAYSVSGVSLFTTNELPDRQALGAVPPGSYMLGFWRGEWWEFFAGWSRKSTLEFDESAFYVSGGFWGDITGYLAIELVLLLAWAWLRPNNAFKPTLLRYADPGGR